MVWYGMVIGLTDSRSAASLCLNTRMCAPAALQPLTIDIWFRQSLTTRVPCREGCWQYYPRRRGGASRKTGQQTASTPKTVAAGEHRWARCWRQKTQLHHAPHPRMPTKRMEVPSTIGFTYVCKLQRDRRRLC